MYYRFNETNNMTGFIKELLKNFNLPTYKVYKENKKLNNGRTYIKENKLYRYTSEEGLKNVGIFWEGRNMANMTSQLRIKSSIYDSYTHEYLGNYLRFVRDYYKLNLMPLYNCFDGVRPIGLNSNVRLVDGEDTFFVLNTDDKKYNYYIVPVKFDEEYTIAIDAAANYEICYMLYNGDTVTDLSLDLIKETYKMINGSSFTSPYVFNPDIDSDKYWQHEETLVLLLKLPKSIRSSITILEGNYLSNCNVLGEQLTVKEYIMPDGMDESSMTPPSKLSLLKMNDGESYPFADRLVEYLLGHVITKLDKIEWNIDRVQLMLYAKDIFKGHLGIWDKNVKEGIINAEFSSYANKENFAKLIYTETNDDYFDINKLRFIDTKYDLLHNVDRDVEELLEYGEWQ